MVKSGRRCLKSSFMNFKIFTNYIIVTDFRGFSTAGRRDDFPVTEEQFNKFRLNLSFAHILMFHSDFVQWHVGVWYVYWYVLALFRPMTNKDTCSSSQNCTGEKNTWEYFCKSSRELEQVTVFVAEHNLNPIWTLWKFVKHRGIAEKAWIIKNI